VPSNNIKQKNLHKIVKFYITNVSRLKRLHSKLYDNYCFYQCKQRNNSVCMKGISRHVRFNTDCKMQTVNAHAGLFIDNANVSSTHQQLWHFNILNIWPDLKFTLSRLEKILIIWSFHWWFDTSLKLFFAFIMQF